MDEFSYHHKSALGAVAFNMLWAAVLGYFLSDSEGAGITWSAVGTALLFSFVIYLIHFGFLFNNTLQLGGGKLTLHRRIGKSREVPLSAIRRFRVAEYRGHAGHKFREMRIRYADQHLRFNVSDLAEEEAFIRALESRLDGRATVLDEPEDPTPLDFIQRQLERLRP
ncbi:hypothetical protein [Lewinella sp. IMCC34183]|uniref:hypothetical protein n=1 Tax=Lewinella sp. IMCC34183 TaxID=2248762 RepID=UPI000E27CCE3|nr:hypothetical protein [Lewinella sp. IMCC34183]